jgi:hypothetical protein
MAGDTTKQMLKRVSWLPEREDGDNGSLMAGQEYDDVFIAGGTIQNVDLLNIDTISLDIPLDITSGGTGANNATSARDNLGLEIGVDVQAYSSVLQNTTASFTTADETKLDGIQAGAQVNVATNLTYTAGTRLLESSTGTDVTLPLVSSGSAGLAPQSGGGTVNFLRSDGTWTLPVTNGDKGDIIVSGSGVVWNIDNSVVTNNKLDNMTANTVKLNATDASAAPTDFALAASQLLGRGSTGNITPITVGQGLSFTGGTLNGVSTGCYLLQVAPKSIPNNTFTVIDFAVGSELWDDNNYHDNTTNNSRITPAFIGRGHLRGKVGFNTATAAVFIVQLRKNGAALVETRVGSTASTGGVILELNHEDSFNATDYYELWCAQVTGVAVNTFNSVTIFQFRRTL